MWLTDIEARTLWQILVVTGNVLWGIAIAVLVYNARVMYKARLQVVRLSHELINEIATARLIQADMNELRYEVSELRKGWER